MQENNTKRVVYVVDGARTPFLKARNKPGAFTASDLTVFCLKIFINTNECLSGYH